MNNYIKSIIAEMKNVIWPSKKNTINHTILVIIISLITAFVLFEFDNLFSTILGIFIS